MGKIDSQNGCVHGPDSIQHETLFLPQSPMYDRMKLILHVPS